jgi:hypothetical protein
MEETVAQYLLQRAERKKRKHQKLAALKANKMNYTAPQEELEEDVCSPPPPPSTPPPSKKMRTSFEVAPIPAVDSEPRPAPTSLPSVTTTPVAPRKGSRISRKFVFEQWYDGVITSVTATHYSVKYTDDTVFKYRIREWDGDFKSLNLRLIV